MFALEKLTKIYQHRNEEVHALDNVTMEITHGSFVVVTGGSGSGKTTLLLTLGGIIHPSSGSLRVKGANLYDYSANQLAAYRNRTVGFVLQTFNLVPYLTALENVMIPMLLNKDLNGRPTESRGRVAESAWLVIIASTFSLANCQSGNSSGWPSHGHWRTIPR